MRRQTAGQSSPDKNEREQDARHRMSPATQQGVASRSLVPAPVSWLGSHRSCKAKPLRFACPSHGELLFNRRGHSPLPFSLLGLPNCWAWPALLRYHAGSDKLKGEPRRVIVVAQTWDALQGRPVCGLALLRVGFLRYGNGSACR